MKYIIYEVNHSDYRGLTEHAIVFADDLTHSIVAKCLHDVRERRARIVSAGFYYNNPMRCEGRSESLRLNSRPEDVVIVGGEYSAAFS